jgi:hypothetical protein
MLTMMKEMPQIRKQKISSGSKQENAKAGVSFLSWKVGSENSKENKQDESLLKTTRRWPGEASHQSKDSGYQKKVTYLPSDQPTYLSHALPSLDRLVPVDRGKVEKSAASKRPISTVGWDSRQVATYRTR